MTEAIPILLFDDVTGSMTSSDGLKVFLRTESDEGDDILLGFKHEQISTIIENLAVQLPHGRSAGGEPMMSAFVATSYALGKGPKGEPVLALQMGKATMNFILSREIVEALIGHLASMTTKN